MLKAFVLIASGLLEKPFAAGKVINDRYTIKQYLGKGSYGISYLVMDQLTNRFVVLKTLRLHKRLTLRGKQSFQREMDLLKSIEHPGFPQFYEHGMYESTPFYTMEYINGKTFEQLIFKEGKVYTEREAFHIGYQLLTLIDVLHKNGIVHRDVRIPNVMLDDLEQIRLIDFGLGRHLTDQKDSFRFVGKEDPRKQIDPASDFYALGHFILFLLYSSYQAPEQTTEKSWEEELNLTPSGKTMIKRLLQIESPYQSVQEVQCDFQQF
jgi:serine/threonine-protein kinase